MTIPICHKKPHIGKETGVWMTSCPEEMVLRIGDFENTSVGYSTFEEWGFLPLSKEVFWISTGRDELKS